MIANSAGNANWGGIFPFPISTPINVPITWLITAPGPSKGDKNGSEQIKPMIVNPTAFPAKGAIMLANTLPIPEPCITPIKRETKAIKGITVRIIVSTASLAD